MIADKKFFIYIMFNKPNGTLYVGVTSDLVRRIWQHKTNAVEGFSKKYGLDKLGYYEIHQTAFSAIEREKQLKAGNRKAKIELITRMNPKWADLYDSILE